MFCSQHLKTMAKSCQGKGNAHIFVVVVALLGAIEGATATTFKVGGTSEWNLGVNYTTWGAGNIYHINDVLNFVYIPDQHDVFEVTEADFESCTSSNAIKKYVSGNDLITIVKPQQFFICSFIGHCGFGMKLAVTTTSVPPPATPPPTSSPPPPPPTSSTPPSPPPTVAPSPPPASPPTAAAPLASPPSPPAPAKAPPHKAPVLPPAPYEETYPEPSPSPPQKAPVLPPAPYKETYPELSPAPSVKTPPPHKAAPALPPAPYKETYPETSPAPSATPTTPPSAPTTAAPESALASPTPSTSPPNSGSVKSVTCSRAATVWGVIVLSGIYLLQL